MYKYSTRLVLKSKRNDFGHLKIEIDFNINGARIRRYVDLNEKILESELVRGRIKSRSQPNLQTKTEARLLQVNELIRKIERAHGKVTPELYDEELGKSKNDTLGNPTLQSLIEEFINARTQILEYRTIQKYETLKTKISEFSETQKSQSKIYLHSITSSLLDQIQKFYISQSLSSSTINKYESCLNTVLDYGRKDRKLDIPDDYKSFKKMTKEEAEKVVLLKEEIEAIRNLKGLSIAEERIRDSFIFQTLTGLRFSDLERVKKAWVKGSTLQFTAFKTLTKCQVPLHPLAKEILDKYDGNFKNIIVSNQYFNRAIKEICKKAGITEENEKLVKVLNRRSYQLKPKYELISSHTARSTFITHCIVAGITPFVIMKYVGHKKITTMQGYVRIAEAIAEESFDKFVDYMKL